MSEFFLFQPRYRSGSIKLKVDYSFDVVPDPHIIFTPDPTPAYFLRRFTFKVMPGFLQDAVANSIGWFVISPVVTKVFRSLCKPGEIELLRLEGDWMADCAASAGMTIFGV
jgi:hypothetical protein